MTEPELHTDEAHRVIAAELVACTLGQRHRPELRTDLAGTVDRINRMMRPLLDVYERYTLTVAEFTKRAQDLTGTR